MEIWKDIEGYPDYKVSSLGRVKSLKFGKEKILKSGKNKKGYLQVALCKEGKLKTFKVHRLVAEAFIPNPDNKPHLDHINTDRTDNRAENLSWVTHKENCNNPITIENYSKCKLGLLNHITKPIVQFTKDGKFVRKWDSMIEVERDLGFCSGYISKCCKGKYKTAYGFKWCYHYKSLWEKKHIPLIKQKKVA